MCGVIGVLSRNRRDLLGALNSINHRGPDGQGQLCLEISEDRWVNLGHVRLSIIDVDERSQQPFSLDGRNILVFNGEIYNYKELKEDLLMGVDLKTSSDTEVLWHLLCKYGVKILDRVVGMYAFIFYTADGNLFVGRDCLGIKPLYRAQDKEGNIYFASEIKALEALGIQPFVDKNAVAEYIQFGYLHEPLTGFSNVHKLLPGQVLSFNLMRSELIPEEVYTSFGSEDKELAKILSQSMIMHSRADVKQSLFFSGGVDSSLLLMSLDSDLVTPVTMSSRENDVKTAGFSSDHEYASRILGDLKLSGEHFDIDFNEKSIERDLDDMVDGIEELICDYTFIASRDLSLKVRNKGFKVAHSGMGADELFGGYPRYLAFFYLEKIGPFLRRFIGLFISGRGKKTGRLLSALKANNVWDRYFSFISSFSQSEINELLSKEALLYLDIRKQKLWSNSLDISSLKTAINVDLIGFLSHNFTVADKSSMLASIEMRVPLANQLTLNWYKKSNDKQLIRLFKAKPELKNELFKYLDKSYFNRKKAGFNPPLDTYIQDLGLDRVIKILNDSPLNTYIDISKAEEIITAHFTSDQNNTYKILNLIYLARWLKRYV